MQDRAVYRTKHKEEVLSFLRSTSGQHYTAAQIREHFLKSGCPIGMATVYRILDGLVQEGILRKYTLQSSSGSCYEYPGNEEHFHCECIKCGSVIHLNCEELQEIQEHLQKDHSFAWDSGKTVFYGICGDCQK